MGFVYLWLGIAVWMAENMPGNASSPTKQRNSAAALIHVAQSFSCSSPSCLLPGWGKPAS